MKTKLKFYIEFELKNELNGHSFTQRTKYYENSTSSYLEIDQQWTGQKLAEYVLDESYKRGYFKNKDEVTFPIWQVMSAKIQIKID